MFCEYFGKKQKEGKKMKKGFFHTELIIDTKRYYPPQELFELLKENFGDRFGEFYNKKELKTLDTIYIEGEDGWVSIDSVKLGSSSKGEITIGLQKPLKKELKFTRKDIIFMILCFVSLGVVFAVYLAIDFFAGIFNLEGTKKNRIMMKAIANEIERIVKD